MTIASIISLYRHVAAPHRGRSPQSDLSLQSRCKWTHPDTYVARELWYEKAEVYGPDWSFYRDGGLSYLIWKGCAISLTGTFIFRGK